MKSLQLSEVISHIDGTLSKGSHIGLIDSISLAPILIKNRTLYFDMYKNLLSDFESISVNKSFAVVTDRPERFENIHGSVAVIKVENLLAAYWNFVDYYRSLLDLPVVGITGTCGKTTTKEMLRHILPIKYSSIVATYKSRNQRSYNLGYLLQINENTQIAVMEMGVTYPGDLLVYCRYFRPQIGIITNIELDHLDQFKTLENYIAEKSTLLEGLGNRGSLILNADNENIRSIEINQFQGRVIYFGIKEQADYKGYDVKETENGIEFKLMHNHELYKISVPILGRFNAYNALAAIAAAKEAGIEIGDAIDRLKSFSNVEKHLQLHKGIKGSIIIDDTWSSNPTSAAEALRFLKGYGEGKKTLAIMGRMTLLGKHSVECHCRLGEQLAEIGIDYLITTDEASKLIAEEAVKKGMNEKCVFSCIYNDNDPNLIMNILDPLLDENTMVLVKTDMFDSYKGLMEKLIIE